MKRIINEDKAWRNIYISTLSIIIFSFLTIGIIEDEIFLLSYAGLFFSIFYFGYACYSLGWEYKHISEKVKE